MYGYSVWGIDLSEVPNEASTTLEELILEQERLCEEMLVLNKEFMAILNKQKRELDNEMNGLLRDCDEPDKTFH